MICKRLFHLRTVPKLYCNAIDSTFNVEKAATHELLARLNIVSHPRAGLVHWLPIGRMIVDKIKGIVTKRMDEARFEQVLLSPLAHRSSWEKTGRWDGQELFKVAGDEFLLAPTAEEEITDYVSKHMQSYKELPLRYYQVASKFRDEKRPRGGLLRGKEFIMKDGYSFDISTEKALETYEVVTDTYHRIFKDLQIPYVRASADTGAIGGSLSHEWHCLHHTGEDTVFICDSCGHTSNVEKTIAYPETVDEEDPGKVSVRYFITQDSNTLVCAYYPEGRALDTNFVLLQVPEIDILVDETEVLEVFSESTGDSLSRKVIRLMDARLHSRSAFPDFPVAFLNRGQISTITDVPLVSATNGEICGECDRGHIIQHRAIEMGHTFYLGDKYTRALGCTVPVPGESGLKQVALEMGCYGIGVSRLVAVAAEMGRDARGLVWPRPMVPWEVTVVEGVSGDYSEFYDLVDEMDYRLDEREKVRVGRKILDSEMVGVPMVVILGRQYPTIEIEIRGGEKRYVPIGEARQAIEQILKAM